MIPREWRLKPKESAHAQLQVIKKLLGEAATVVNTGDPDREGQLLVDEVLEHFRTTDPKGEFVIVLAGKPKPKRETAADEEE